MVDVISGGKDRRPRRRIASLPAAIAVLALAAAAGILVAYRLEHHRAATEPSKALRASEAAPSPVRLNCFGATGSGHSMRLIFSLVSTVAGGVHVTNIRADGYGARLRSIALMPGCGGGTQTPFASLAVDTSGSRAIVLTMQITNCAAARDAGWVPVVLTVKGQQISQQVTLNAPTTGAAPCG